MTRIAQTTSTVPPATPIPAPRREPALVSASEYPTEPLNADAAAALDRLYSRIHGDNEVA